MPSWLFPQGGINKAVGKQRQPPFTTPDAQNALPESPQDGRIRGGVRPGQVRAWKTSSTSPIRPLDTINVKIPGSNQTLWRDSFEYSTFPTSWVTSDTCITGVTSTAPTLSRGSIIGNTSDAVAQKVIRRVAPTDMKTLGTGDVYRIGMYIRPYQNAHHGIYSIYARLDASPAIADTNAIEVRFQITGTGTVFAQVLGSSWSGSTYSTTDTVNTEGWFEVVITKGASHDAIAVYWRGELLGTVASGDAISGTTTDKNFGFGMRPTVSGGRCIVDRVRLDYPASSAKEQLRPITFFVQDGILYHDKAMPGIFAATASNYRFHQTDQIQCATLGGRVYFADRSDPLFSSTDGEVATANTFSSSNNANLITNGLSNTPGDNNWVGNYAVHITESGGEAIYACTAVTNSATDTITIYKHVDSALAVVTGGATNGTGLDYRIERIPKVWDPVTDTITPWVTISASGTVPVGCRAIEADGARLYLAADPLDPNQVYGSAIGEPHNWNFSDVEPGSAFELGTGEAGKTGDAVTGIIPYKDDTKLIGCRTECWIIKGAPPDGGVVERVSKHAGLLSFSAYTQGPDGNLFWIGRGGVNMAVPQCLACEPQELSNVPMPRELQDLDPGSLTILAGYDRRSHGALFCLTPNEAIAGVRHWFYYEPTKAFFPVVLGSTNSYPTALKWIDCLDPEDSGLYAGCFGGSIRRFSFTAANDDLSAITSYVDIGPISLAAGDGRLDTALTALRPILAADSGNLTYAVYFGATMEAAMDSTTVFSTGTFTAASNVEIPVRGSGGAVRLRITGTAGSQWALEQIVAVIEHQQGAR